MLNVVPVNSEMVGVPGLLEPVANMLMAKPPMVPLKLPVVLTTSPGIAGGLSVVLTAMSRPARAGVAIPIKRIAATVAMGAIELRKYMIIC
jgi:hypothetical protein